MTALEPEHCLRANKRTHLTALTSRALLVKEHSFFLCSKEAGTQSSSACILVCVLYSTPTGFACVRCRANSAQTRRSRPDSGLDLSHLFRRKCLKCFKLFLLRSGVGSACGAYLQACLTECIHQSILESHPSRKIVNLLFTSTNSNIKLSVLWGSQHSKPN